MSKGLVSSTVGRARTDRGRVSRLVTRTLLVLGGTVAATAVGWLISSATASADTLPDLAVPGTHADPAPVSTTVTGMLDAVRVPAISPPPAVAGALRGAVTQLGNHVPVGRDIPVTPLAAWSVPSPQAPRTVPAAASQSGPAIGSAARPITAETTVAPIPPGPATVVQRYGVTHADPGPSAVPAFLTLPAPGSPPAPWSPMTVPAAPAGSVGNAPGGAGLGLADASGVLPVPGLDVMRALPVTARPGQATAGKQPGISPD